MIRDTLTPGEREELKNAMLHEPVEPGKTISHATASSLHQKHLLIQTRAGWMVDWEHIKEIAS